MSESLHALIRILADGRFHSGTQLGEHLGISRAAVWKHIDKVAELGLDIHSVRGKGYRLHSPLDLLDPAAITTAIGAANDRLQSLDILETIDSTNSHAMRLLQSGSLMPASGKYGVILAEQQTSGKGRRGRRWVSPYGQNLYLTMVRLVDTGSMKTDGISLVVGLALVRAIKTLGLKGMGVKWPNDVLHDGSKLAGILLEINGDITGICQLIVGVGVNIHCAPETMASVEQPWTDLTRIGGVTVDRNRLAGDVVRHIMEALAEFEQHGLKTFMEEWRESDVMMNRDVELVTGSGSRYGRALGISESGALLLETDTGIEQVNGGEISLRGIST